jgi:hypothetical protein
VSGGPVLAAGMPGGARLSGRWQAPVTGPPGVAGLSRRRTLIAEVPGGEGLLGEWQAPMKGPPGVAGLSRRRTLTAEGSGGNGMSGWRPLSGGGMRR